ncbi:hypothetical protein HKX48_006928 [Thoreauomyces humboldtii]|nr:hypothetical protein HKX48_006928 [Thoreauomyces humboldtii]
MHKQAAIAGPLAMVGICQIIFGALPTLLANRTQYRKPIWYLSFSSCIVLLASAFSILDQYRVFTIDWTQEFPIDTSAPTTPPDDMSAPNLLGWYFTHNVVSNPWTRSNPILISTGQILYEIVSAFRAGALYGQNTGMMKVLYGLTTLACMGHVATAWTITFWNVVKGPDSFQAHADDFAKASIADLSFAVFVELITNLMFMYNLIEKMGRDK